MEFGEIQTRPWTRDKLRILGQYLHAYSVIMAAQKRTRGTPRPRRWLDSYAYIDAFAGVGSLIDADTQSYVDGSPLVALGCKPEFDECWFVELSPQRLATLQARVAESFPDRDVHFECGDANSILRDSIVPQFPHRSRRRAFAFLDPYGLDIEFDTVRRLADSRTFDVFINLSTMGITRLCPRDEMPDEAAIERISRVVGDRAWVRDLYTKWTDLFGEEHASRDRLDPMLIATHYLTNLRGLFPYVSDPVLMRNSLNAPLYVLLLASHNETAVGITNSIIVKHYRQGPEQPRLL